MNILVIESDAVLGSIYQRLLETQGYKPLIVSSSQEAIFACEAEKPDCIVLETRLARHNGIAFLHELRSYDDWQDIPVIVNSYTATSKLNSSVREQFGIKRVLYKPSLNLNELLEAIRSLKAHA